MHLLFLSGRLPGIVLVILAFRFERRASRLKSVLYRKIMIMGIKPECFNLRLLDIELTIKPKFLY